MLNVIGIIMILSGLFFIVLVVPKKRTGGGDAVKKMPVDLSEENDIGDDEDDELV